MSRGEKLKQMPERRARARLATHRGDAQLVRNGLLPLLGQLDDGHGEEHLAQAPDER